MHETQARRGVRRGAAVLLAMVLALSLGWQRTWADEGRQLIPVGKAVGIKLFADGVLVVSVSPVQGTEETRSPAKECGLKEGDILLTFNGEKIRSTEHLQAMLAENGETAAELTVQRDGKTLEVTASPVVCEDGGIRLGAWIRDSMAGVGTLTYYDPATGSYGALGHGITDVDTAELMPLASGSIMETMVKAVKKGQRGAEGGLYRAAGCRHGDGQQQRGHLWHGGGCGFYLRRGGIGGRAGGGTRRGGVYIMYHFRQRYPCL